MDFITLDMFLSLAGCVAIVSILTQALKKYVDVNPLKINLVFSLLVGLIRIIIIGDFTLEGIVLGLLNVFVIMLAAGGTYDTAKMLIKKEE